MKSKKQTPNKLELEGEHEGHGKLKVWKINWAIYFLRGPANALAAFDSNPQPVPITINEEV
jgi:hypothetical protein